MSFLTLIHIGGGSTVEAAQAVHVGGPFPTRADAEQFGDDVYQLATGVNPATSVLSVLGPRPQGYLATEMFHTVIELPATPASAADIASELKGRYGD